MNIVNARTSKWDKSLEVGLWKGRMAIATPAARIERAVSSVTTKSMREEVVREPKRRCAAISPRHGN